MGRAVKLYDVYKGRKCVAENVLIEEVAQITECLPSYIMTCTCNNTPARGYKVEIADEVLSRKDYDAFGAAIRRAYRKYGDLKFVKNGCKHEPYGLKSNRIYIDETTFMRRK